MTTDLRLVVLALPVALAGWIAVAALTLRLSGTAPAAMVLFPPDGLAEHLPPDTVILSAGPASLTLRGGTDLVARLYRAGAPLVLPAGLGGCLGEGQLPLGL